MTPTEYLRNRSIIHPNKADLTIQFTDGNKLSLIEIMDSYYDQKSKPMRDMLIKLLKVDNVAFGLAGFDVERMKEEIQQSLK